MSDQKDPFLRDFEDVWTLAAHRLRRAGSGVVPPPYQIARECITAERHTLLKMDMMTREFLFVYWAETLLVAPVSDQRVREIFGQAIQRYLPTRKRKRRPSITKEQ